MGASKSYGVITVGSVATSLTAGEVALYSTTYKKPPQKVICTVEDAPIRVRWDSAAANVSTIVGHLLNIGDILELEGITDIQNFRTIASTATSASLKVTYEY